MGALKPKLELIVGGVQKGGTTALARYLEAHPQLHVYANKEAHFFDNEARDWNLPADGEIAALYPDNRGRVPVDVTPIYLFWPRALERIYAYNPDAKLVFIFRDPIERAWSQWRMSISRGWDTMPFSEAIREGGSRLNNHTSLRVHSYVERGLYAVQLRRVFSIFPRKNVLLLRSQDMRREPTAGLQSIATLAGIAPFAQTAPMISFATPEDGNILSAGDECYLRALFREDLAEFSLMSGIDVSNWLTMAD